MDTLQESSLYRFYYYINYDLQDPRTIYYPLLMRPFTMLFFVIFYNYFCRKLGPKIMENIEPFSLRYTMIVFNVFQIIINIYLFLDVASLWCTEYNIFCEQLNFEDKPLNRRVARLMYIYFLVKMSDTVDTVFMVMKKKNSHISFLHLYHHTGMIALSWGGVKFVPGGHHVCIGLYNTAIHTIMYFYYLVAVLYPNYKMPRFKKFTTQAQMLQFLFILLHTCTVIVTPGCSYPKWILAVLVPNNTMIFLLFFDFYKKTYGSKKRTLKDQSEQIKSKAN